MLSKIRKLEKLDFRRRKTQLDITFLEVCLDKDIIPNFLQFRTANSKLGNSETYITCQRLLLHKRDLSNLLTPIDFLFVTSLFLEKNARICEEIEQSQNGKLSKLIADNPKHEVKNLIFTFSSHVLTDSQESILMKCLNYALPPKNLKYEDYLLNFELLFRSVNGDNYCKDGQMDNFKFELRNTAYSSFKSYNRKKKKLDNITADEHKALNQLLSLENIIIKKPDKGNVIVL